MNAAADDPTAAIAGPHEFSAGVAGYAIRPARPEDEPALRRMLERATPGDIHLRFFRHMKIFPHEVLAPMLQVDADRHFALVAVPHDESAMLAGSAMLAVEPGTRSAEFGLIVERSHAGRRLGTHLLRCLLLDARSHAIETVFGVILAENFEMIDLVERLGFRVTPDRDDPGCVRAEIHPGGPGNAR